MRAQARHRGQALEGEIAAAPVGLFSESLSMASAKRAGATAQPMRQPVMAWDLDTELTITERSAMPGRAQGLE